MIFRIIFQSNVIGYTAGHRNRTKSRSTNQRTNAKYYTVAIGLWQMLEKEYVDVWYTRFAAGAVLISIPIAALFMIMQRCYNESMTGAVKG